MLKSLRLPTAGRAAGLLCVLVSACLFGPVLPGVAHAVEVPTLYTAEVPLNNDADDPRAEAYARALRQVLMRVSGAELAEDPYALDALFPDPAAYVIQFRPGGEETLWVSFDGEAIESLLRESGQTVWGADRPLTLVWLAVDWGQGRREIIGADDADSSRGRARSIDRNKRLRERVLAIAEKRGLPLVFPLLDTTDLQRVTFSDIWGGFDERIVEASGRYDVNSILIGRVRPSPGRENWTYYFGGEERSWNGPPEVILGQIANLLAAEFAVGGDARVETVALSVAGIQTIDAYGSLQKLLAGINVIENVRIVEVFGDRVSYVVDVHGGANRLSRALRFNGLIEQDRLPGPGDAEPVDRGGLEFFYSP